MTNLRINEHYINSDHVIRFERIEAEAERIEIDDNSVSGDETVIAAKPFSMIVVLTELDCNTGGWDYHTYGEYAIPANKRITVSGAQAERLAAWLDREVVLFGVE